MIALDPDLARDRRLADLPLVGVLARVALGIAQREASAEQNAIDPARLTRLVDPLDLPTESADPRSRGRSVDQEARELLAERGLVVEQVGDGHGGKRSASNHTPPAVGVTDRWPVGSVRS